MRADPETAAAAAPSAVARNSDLVWTWDLLSLALYLDWAPHGVPRVPADYGPAELELTAQDGWHVLEPWPFAAEAITVRCEGKRLSEPLKSDQALQAALASAPVETVLFELRSA